MPGSVIPQRTSPPPGGQKKQFHKTGTSAVLWLESPVLIWVFPVTPSIVAVADDASGL